jgi:hypothetical protein
LDVSAEGAERNSAEGAAERTLQWSAKAAERNSAEGAAGR